MSGLQLSDNTIDRDALRVLGNGKLVALLKWMAGVAIAAVAAYYAAQTEMDRRLTRVETRQDSTDREVLRRLDRIENSLDRLRESR